MGDRPKATTTTTTTSTTTTSASPGAGAAIATEVTAMAATVPQEAAQANGAGNGNGPATGNGNAGNGNGNGGNGGNGNGNGNVGSPQEPGAAVQVDQPAGDSVQLVDAVGLPSGGDAGDDAATDAGASSLPPSEIGGRPPLDTACSDGGGASSLAGGIVGPPSPLTGCYLLIVMGEPHSEEHKDNILQHLLKGKCYSRTCYVQHARNTSTSKGHVHSEQRGSGRGGVGTKKKRWKNSVNTLANQHKLFA